MKQLVIVCLMGLLAILLPACAGPAETPEDERQNIIKGLLTQLTSQDHSEREIAVDFLSYLNAKESIPDITKLLHHNDPTIRRIAVDALGKLNAKEAIPDITKLLDNNEPGVRRSAVLALVELGAKEAVPQIIKLLQDNNSNVRQVAVVALGKLSAKESIPQIIALLQDTDFGVRLLAIEALGILGDKEAIPEIVKLLDKTDNSDQFSRGVMAVVIVELGAKDKVPVKSIEDIKSLLGWSDDNNNISSRARAALKELGVEDK